MSETAFSQRRNNYIRALKHLVYIDLMPILPCGLSIQFANIDWVWLFSLLHQSLIRFIRNFSYPQMSPLPQRLCSLRVTSL